METRKRTGFFKQVYILAFVCLLVSSILTLFVQRSLAFRSIERERHAVAANISDEVVSSIKEYPAYRWLLRYWYEHSDELDIEYDVDFGGGTATELKVQTLLERNPGFHIEYANARDVERLSPEDRKLYAEIVYTWLTNRIDQIKRNYDVEFLYVIMTDTKAGDQPYQTQYFLMSGADEGAVRGREYGQVYLLGTLVSVADNESLMEAMRSTVENSRPGSDAGSGGSQTATYVGTGSEFADFYAYVDQINAKAVLVGITYTLTDLEAAVSTEVVQGSLTSVLLQLLLLVIVMRFLFRFVLVPLKKVIGNIRFYTETKDSDTTVRNLTELLQGSQGFAVRRNEIGELSEDVVHLAHEIDDYVSEIEAITVDREKMAAELGLASRIQADMLPSIFPPFPDRTEFDIYAAMDPAREVGGDFFDFFFIDDDHLAIAIADVSGKGVPAALFMMASMIMLHDSALVEKDPARVLESINNSIGSANRESMFVTVWLGVLEVSTGRLVAANAGHECPVVMHPGGDFEMVRDKHGFVIGALENMRYTSYEIQLEPGSKLFVYTDGVPEATAADMQMLGTERMVETLRGAQDGTPEQIIGSVKQAIKDFVGDAEQFDDVTMLCLEYKGAE